jgi:hypothetical protein
MTLFQLFVMNISFSFLSSLKEIIFNLIKIYLMVDLTLLESEIQILKRQGNVNGIFLFVMFLVTCEEYFHAKDKMQNVPIKRKPPFVITN